MKQKYVRPEVFYESFQLSQHVAACGWDIQLKDGTTCVAFYDPTLQNTPIKDRALFTDGLPCTIKEGDSYEYCYTTGADGIKVFNS